MKISSEKFLSFLSKATLNGTIPTAIVKIENKEMNVWVRSIDNTIAVNATLKNVDAENQAWPIKNAAMFLDCLKLFTGIVELVQHENKLSMFNATKQVDFVLAEASYVDNAMDKYPSVEYALGESELLNTDVFKNILKNKSIVKTPIVNFKTSGTSLEITTGSDKFDVITDKVECKILAASVNLSSTADEIFGLLDGKVTVGIKTDYPILFKWETPDYKIQYVAAHILHQESEE
jgi:hypothetical protein